MKAKLEQTLQDYVTLGQAWLDFSKATVGWSIEEYTKPGLKVRCYFADASTHTSASFYVDGVGLIAVGFFRPAKVDFNITDIRKLIDRYEQFRSFLEECKNEQVTRSAVEKEQARIDEVANLKRRLNELAAPTKAKGDV